MPRCEGLSLAHTGRVPGLQPTPASLASAGLWQCLLHDCHVDFSEMFSLIFCNHKDDKDTCGTVPDSVLSAVTLSIALNPSTTRERRTAYSYVPWS